MARILPSSEKQKRTSALPLSRTSAISSTETAESEQQKPAKKTVKEDIKKPPAKKGKKKGERIPLNPEAFAKMSVGIEKLTLGVHKKKEDKVLKDTEYIGNVNLH